MFIRAALKFENQLNLRDLYDLECRQHSLIYVKVTMSF